MARCGASSLRPCGVRVKRIPSAGQERVHQEIGRWNRGILPKFFWLATRKDGQASKLGWRADPPSLSLMIIGNIEVGPCGPPLVVVSPPA